MNDGKRLTLADAIASGQRLDAGEMLALLRTQVSVAGVDRPGAEMLLALDRATGSSAPEWCSSLADAVLGAAGDGVPAWLEHEIAPHGRIETAAGMEILVRAIARAEGTAFRLAAFALNQLRAAVIAGEGPAIGARRHFSRVIDKPDTDLIVRILLAAGGPKGAAVSRVEAEALFDLHDAVAGELNAPIFDELFFRAIASHAFSGSSVAMQSRELTLLPEARPNWLMDGRQKLGAEEAAWLAERIMRDGRPTSAERALLALLDAEKPAAESLRRLLDCAA